MISLFFACMLIVSIQAAPCTSISIANMTRIYLESKPVVDECAEKAFPFFPPTVQRVEDEKLISFCEQPICMSLFPTVIKYYFDECSLNGVRVREYIFYHKERCAILSAKTNSESKHPACT